MKHKDLLKQKKRALNDAQKNLDAAQKSLTSITDKIKWYENYSLYNEEKKKENLTQKRQHLKKENEGFKDELNQLKNKHRVIDKKTGSILNPFNWFDENEIKLRAQRQELADAIKLTEKKIKTITTKIEQINVEIGCLEDNEKKYRSMNISEEREFRRRLLLDIDKKESLLKQCEMDLHKIYSSIQGLLDEYKTWESELEDCKEKVTRAEKYGEKLDKANNSYERAMIHQECRDELGDGNPGKIISKLQRDIEILERKMKKLDNRICKEIEKNNRKIDVIIIDGNNLCYDKDKFIGIKRVVALEKELTQKKYSVIVFFDPGICGMLKMSKKEISKQFDDSVNVYISNEEADYMILEYADSHRNSWILSNDNYDEFFDKKTIKEGRIMQAKIHENKICIPDLDIEVIIGSR